MKYQDAQNTFKRCRNKAKGYLLPGRQGSTRLVQLDDKTYGVQLHNTIVVEIHSNGEYTLNSGGWLTPTTKERINTYSPARVSQDKRLWYVDGMAFFDGIRVNAKGKVNTKLKAKASKAEAKAKFLTKKLREAGVK